MQTPEINNADEEKKKRKTPNRDTIAAMKELQKDKGKRFKSVEDLFKSI
jgi:hypothetical protein